VDNAIITVRCVCGWVTSGTETDVVAATAEHGRRLHNMTPTHDEVLAMAVEATDGREVPVKQPGPGER
jgi:predicted small metal-binding protein